MKDIPFDDKLTAAILLTEEGVRLRPAIVRMHRGTVIRADYFRAVRGEKGLKMLVVGIGPGEGSLVKGPQAVRKPHGMGYKIRQGSKPSWVQKLPDFYRVWHDEEYGWHVKSLFRSVLTMNIVNIQSIKEVNKH